MKEFFNYQFLAGFSIMFCFLTYHVLFRNEKHFNLNRKILLLSLFLSCCLPLIKLPLFDSKFFLSNNFNIFLKEIIISNSDIAKNDSFKPIEIWDYLLSGYIIISSFYFVRFLFSLLKIKSIVKSSQKSKNGKITLGFSNTLNPQVKKTSLAHHFSVQKKQLFDKKNVKIDYFLAFFDFNFF